MKKLNRREALLASALSFGSVSLRSLITGLPVPFLLGSQNSFAQHSYSAKFVILSHLQGADPLGANAPGSYAPVGAGDSHPLHQVQHPTVAELGAKAAGFENPATLSLGGHQVKAATPWAGLPQGLLDRSAFWHHGTFTNAHPDFDVVLRLNGALKKPDGSGTDHLGSFLAYENHQLLGTLSAELIRVGGSTVESNGIAAPLLRPNSLKSIFAQKVAYFDQTVALRDQFLDQAYSDIKANGTPAQRKFLDRYATSRSEAQSLGDGLADLITDIDGNDALNQVKMAVALIQLNVAPVVTLGLPFGGDNHQDSDLNNEVTETQGVMTAIETLWQKLTAAGIEDRVLFASLNTFGRTLLRNDRGGRDHNGAHHSMFIFGDNIKPGEVGGMQTFQRRRNQIDFQATAINSQTGGSNNPDIPYPETFVAVGKTLATAAGVPSDRIEKRIDGGKVIAGALL